MLTTGKNQHLFEQIEELKMLELGKVDGFIYTHHQQTQAFLIGFEQRFDASITSRVPSLPTGREDFPSVQITARHRSHLARLRR